MDKDIHRFLTSATNPRHKFAEHYGKLKFVMVEAKKPQYSDAGASAGSHYLVVSRPYVCAITTAEFERLALDVSLDERGSRHGNYFVLPFEFETEARIVRAFLAQVYGLSATISSHLRN